MMSLCMATLLRSSPVVQHGFYAEALRAHLRPLATGVSLGTICSSSNIVRFVQGGVVKTFRCRDGAFPDVHGIYV